MMGNNSCLYVLLVFILAGGLALVFVMRWAMRLLEEHKEAEVKETIPAPRGMGDIDELVRADVPDLCHIYVPVPCRDFRGKRPPERHGSGT